MRRFAPLLLALLFLPATAEAHGFGQRYALPLPLDLFIAGGTAVVALSFVIVAMTLRQRAEPRPHPLGTLPHGLTIGLQAVSVSVFALTLLAGFIGTQNPYQNLTVVMVWVIGWVGFAFVSALLGNWWTLLNPWSVIFAPVKSLALPYPDWLGRWPAFLLFFAFGWMENNWPGSGIPFNISMVLGIYSLITWTGMVLFGRKVWLEHGEIFAIVFSLFARFSPLNVEDDGQIAARAPGLALKSDRPADFSTVAFILLVLAVVTYDGFSETGLFQEIALAFYRRIDFLGISAVYVVSTVLIAAVPLIFLAVYVLVAALVAICGGQANRAGDAAGLFITSIVPIAIAYHLAHYLSLLLIDGQNVIAIASDPFGYDWNLFGTADYHVDPQFLGAGFVWYFSLAAIVCGHVAAVYLAHGEALALYGTRSRALVSQVPMVLLMVGYTMVSLWIIAQPITG